ncbi:hypothetical protein HDV00_002765 [Rhizophlyctis rosea]|nr:hypothetical protein HDV00_002765 [Rhizophlyctis rosea]
MAPPASVEDMIPSHRSAFRRMDQRSESNDGYTFELAFRQQPSQARMSGFAQTMERRLIDPAPVLQLILRKGGKVIPVSHETYSTYVCHATLVAMDGETDRSVVVRPTTGGTESDHSPNDAHASSEAAAPAIDARHSHSHIHFHNHNQPSSQPQQHPTTTAHSYPPTSVPSYQHQPPFHHAPHHQPPRQPFIPSPDEYPTSLQTTRASYFAPTPATQPLPPPYTPHALPTPPTPESATPPTTSVPTTIPPPPLTHLCWTLVGTTVAQCTILTDIDGTEGMYFVFHDLSVRTRGTYRLKFSLVDVSSFTSLITSTSGRVKTTLTSQAFEVFTPVTFPGTMEPTELSRCFARQGVPIHIRRDFSGMKGKSAGGAGGGGGAGRVAKGAGKGGKKGKGRRRRSGSRDGVGSEVN